MTRQLLTGCISAGAASGGGGGGIPASIIARDNLAHWWKLTDGATSTSSASDEGVSAASTDMTLTGAANVSSDGPSEIGTPDVIEFNGSTGLGEVKARDGGSDTALGTLFASDNFTVTWWMKDDAGSYSNWASWVACLADNSWTSGGWGIYYYYFNFYVWEGAHNQGGYSGSWSGASSWRHHAIRYNGAGGSWQHFLNGTQNATINATINTDVSAATDAYFTLAGVKKPNGTIEGRTGSKMCDVRLYDIVLTDSNISDIADGDWT